MKVTRVCMPQSDHAKSHSCTLHDVFRAVRASTASPSSASRVIHISLARLRNRQNYVERVPQREAHVVRADVRDDCAQMISRARHKYEKRRYGRNVREWRSTDEARVRKSREAQPSAMSDDDATERRLVPHEQARQGTTGHVCSSPCIA
jgi:hypothetical protein